MEGDRAEIRRWRYDALERAQRIRLTEGPLSDGDEADLPPSERYQHVVFEFGSQTTISPATRVSDPTALGLKITFDIERGTISGDRIAGTLVGGDGEWLVLGPDRLVRLDLQGNIKTTDGEFVHYRYGGLFELNPEIETALTEPDADFPGQYFRTAPKLEAGDERYGWVNRTLFVGEGLLLPQRRIEHRVFRLERRPPPKVATQT